MKLTIISALVLAASAASASAETFIERAPVVDVQPAYVQRQSCDNVQVAAAPVRSRGGDTGSIVGAALGGLLGSQIDKDSQQGRYYRGGAGTVAGTAIGADIGSRVYANIDGKGADSTRQVCRNTRGIEGYDVTYMVGGRRVTKNMPSPPAGNTIDVVISESR